MTSAMLSGRDPHWGDMDWDLLCRLLKEMREAGVEEIGLFYLGESFLYRKLPDAIAYARELGYPYIFLTTNGRLATPDRVRALRDPLPCWAVFTEGHITYDGKLAACCFDHDGRFNMGDLKEMSFTDAWRSKAFQALRNANLCKEVRGTAYEECIAYR